MTTLPAGFRGFAVPPESARHWAIGGGGRLDLARPIVMGVLNVTPDSFSDGGRHLAVADAVAAGRRMVEAGAGILDVGGESTRPGAERVPAAEQIRRVVPVIERLAAAVDVPISIDTTLGPVARAALAAGARIVNDVAAGTEDPDLLAAAAEHAAGLVLMHRLRPPDEDAYSDRYARPPVYADPVAAVRDFLRPRIAAARSAGVAEASIAIDPGLGFGKSVDDNHRLIARGAELLALGRPILSGSSRKSFIGAVTGRTTPADRLHGSVAAAVLHAAAGARIIRVHDVPPHVDAMAVLAAVLGASEPPAPSGRPAD
jgi:dihydropteroate synthase